MVEKVLHLSEMEQYEFSLNAERVDVKEALVEVCWKIDRESDPISIDS